MDLSKLEDATTMTNEMNVEKSPEKSSEKSPEVINKIHRNQIIASIIASLTLISCGLCFAWPMVYLQNEKRDELAVHPDEIKWIDSALLVGASVGPILSGLLIDRIGRKWFLYLLVSPILACWILTFFAKSFTLFYMARLVGGLSIGAIYTVIPIYTGEIAEARVRGAMNGIMAVSLNLGYVFTYGVGQLFNRKDLAVINLIPVMVFGLTFVWMPESPYYYLKKHRQKAAEVSLAWLRGKINNEQEIDEIKTLIESEKECSIKEVFTVPAHRKALLILMLLCAGQQISGLMAIQSFAKFLLPQIDVKSDIRGVLIIIAAIILLGSLIITLLVDVIGRKPAFLLSAYGVTITLLTTGAYSFLYEHGMKPTLNSFPWLPLLIIAIHCIIYSVGLGSIPVIVSSEIFPLNVKSFAIMVANIFSFVVAFIVAICYPLIVDAFGYHILFFVFGALELVIAIIATIVMPETSRQSFTRIQEILKANSKNNPSTSTPEPVTIKEGSA